MAAPDPDSVGVGEMMRSALDRAGVEPERVGYINAHGTATPLGDAAETRAVKEVFGEHAYPECDLDYVPNEAREADIEVALSNAMGLGGHNGCVLLGKV